jgi:hypothetical protein
MLFCIGSGTGLAKFCAVRDRATDDDPGLLDCDGPGFALTDQGRAMWKC